MPESVNTQATPHSDVSYAGFPASGVNGYGLWCPICGLPLYAVIHEANQVRGLHNLHRTSQFELEKWYCVIQGVGYGA